MPERPPALEPWQGASTLRTRPLLIGTRGSPLALCQASHVRGLLLAERALAGGAIELAAITTSGDSIQDRPLRDFGGKGLFTKEIDEALLDRRVDLAVHSMKDLPTELPPGLAIGAVLRRGDVRDALISRERRTLANLPPGAVLGTSSLRRQAQVRRLRSDLEVTDFRGNVETRLKKLDQGRADATLLALAGLERLGLAGHATEILAPEAMLPAVAQGAIGVVIREDDTETLELLQPLNDPETALTIACERAFLKVLDGSCKTPIAGLAEVEDGALRFRGLILTPDGSAWHEVEMTGVGEQAAQLGNAAGKDLLSRAGADFLVKFGAS
jgi:hydroxymethylbilane synthase